MDGRWSVGDTFGPYELRAALGKGGMGQVFEAYDRQKDRLVALKLLDPQLAADESFRERFRRESYAAARLNEPHVIPIHDWGTIDGTLYIDMRLVRGRDLRAVLREQTRIDPARAVHIVSQVAAALDAAHAEGLIHRDVKPENVLLTADDFAYLVDFGIVQMHNRGGLTSVGSAIGSVASMAPERFDNRPATPAADVYSLGCLLVECLTGAASYTYDSTAAMLRAHLYEPPPRPTDRIATLPIGFDDVVAGAMAKDPAARFASAGAFAHAARNALMTPPRGSRHPTMRSTRPARPSVRGRRILVGVGATLVIASAAVGAWLLAGGVFASDGSAESPTTGAAGFTTNVGASPPESIGASSPESTGSTLPRTSDRTATTEGPADPAPLNAVVADAGERGFTDGLGPQCLGSEFAQAIGTSPSSRFLICQNADGERYYNGMRMSDGSDIQLADPVDIGNGTFEVVNPTDGTGYRMGPAGLVITSGGVEVLNEPVTAYAYRE